MSRKKSCLRKPQAMIAMPWSTLLDEYRSDTSEPDEETIRRNWRSIACRVCGVCCHSPLVPITRAESDLYCKAIGADCGEEIFAELFLSVGVGDGPHTIETERYGGRCMFLERDMGVYGCHMWTKRPEVCARFFCWPMENFSRYRDGEQQDMFNTSSLFMENFELLLDKIAEETIGSLFESDQIQLIKNRTHETRTSWYQSNRAELAKEEEK